MTIRHKLTIYIRVIAKFSIVQYDFVIDFNFDFWNAVDIIPNKYKKKKYVFGFLLTPLLNIPCLFNI